MGLLHLRGNHQKMSKLLTRLKPGVHTTTHLLLAASLWTMVGFLLIARGIHWLWTGQQLLLVLPGLFLGTLKSFFILDKTAKKSIKRILLLKDGTCLGAVYSKKTWLLVLLMMGIGMVLRRASLPASVLGIIYITIGWALLFSSRNAWKIWFAPKKPHL